MKTATTNRERIERAVEPLIRRGFIVKQTLESPEAFGNARVVLASPSYYVRVTSDRGQIFIGIRRDSDEKWFDLGELLTLVGLRARAGPFGSAEDAVKDLEEYEEIIVRVLSTDNLRAGLVTRR